jgi:hypothetical protein
MWDLIHIKRASIFHISSSSVVFLAPPMVKSWTRPCIQAHLQCHKPIDLQEAMCLARRMPLFHCTHELTSLNMHIMVVWTARTAAADLLGMTWGSTLHYGNKTLRRRPRAMPMAFCRGRRRSSLNRNPTKKTVGLVIYADGKAVGTAKPSAYEGTPTAKPSAYQSHRPKVGP